MKTTMLATAIALAVSTSAFAADLKFEPKDSRFSWDSYEALKDVNLKGETITVFGPWLTGR